jgi:hypothetical protein
MNAEAVLRHIDPSEIKPSLAAYYRRYVITRLVIADRTYDDLNDDVSDVAMRTRPQMKKCDWIQCDQCDRWLHKVCFGIRSGIEIQNH